MIISGCLHVAADGIVWFSFMAEWLCVVSVYRIFIHSVHRHLGCLHDLYTVKSAAVITGVHVSF